MGLLHILLGLLLPVMIDAFIGPCTICGCMRQDSTEIEKDDYLLKELRTEEYREFVGRMYDAFNNNYLAYSYINSYPTSIEPPPEFPGNSVCPSEDQHVFGYFKNYGLTLCLVVKPEIQRVTKVECCSEGPPCGKNTRCVPSGFCRRRYLVFCDAIYRDHEGCLVGSGVLDATRPDNVDPSDFTGPIKRRKREEDETLYDSTTDERVKRDIFCRRSFGYFAFRDDFLPSTCTVTECNCG
ncbi:uncharacterized protein LOC117335081 [Pecten maximus]|uniref:uncharacterized protein LOC117335081 n=1 Tax=Pecten maximus TaxID=6579 RepID=UPI001458F37E|nr:uncharacterized protein LOC117335081 [Pecten maximus]